MLLFNCFLFLPTLSFLPADTQVVITPLDNDDNPVTDSQFIGGTKDGDIFTTCGCISSEPTGAPTELELEQRRGRVLFSWIDHSHCESGFTFYRDGVSLTASYAVSSEQACGARHEPVDVYDDLEQLKDGEDVVGVGW